MLDNEFHFVIVFRQDPLCDAAFPEFFLCITPSLCYLVCLQTHRCEVHKAPCVRHQFAGAVSCSSCTVHNLYNTIEFHVKCDSCHHSTARGEDALQTMEGSSRGEPIRGGPQAWVLGRGLPFFHHKKLTLIQCQNGPQISCDVIMLT
jgi:hypothetical protein